MDLLLNFRKFYCVSFRKLPLLNYIYIAFYKLCTLFCVKKNLSNTLYFPPTYLHCKYFHFLLCSNYKFTFTSSLVFTHSYKCSGSTVEALLLYGVFPCYTDLEICIRGEPRQYLQCVLQLFLYSLFFSLF